MSDEEVIFEPKPVHPRLRFHKAVCGQCGGLHATFWRSVEPPGCVERQTRQTKAERAARA